MQIKTEAEILYRLLAIDCELNPENNVSGEEIPLERIRDLEKERIMLVKSLGREPTSRDFFSL